nr:translation initiation factor IF-2-like [Ovis aries]
MAPDAVRAAPAGIRTQAPSGLPYRRGLLRAACRRRPLGSSSRAAAGGPETRVSLDRFRGRGLGARPGLGDSDGKRAASAPSEPVGPVRAGCAGDIGFGSDPGPGGRPGSAPRPGSASCLTFRPEAQGNTCQHLLQGLTTPATQAETVLTLNSHFSPLDFGSEQPLLTSTFSLWTNALPLR